MTIITLTTDFGLTGGYTGILKGVILGIAPHARLVDLSHDIGPHNVRQAAYVLAAAAPYFPAGTVHLAVIDPGVGSARRGIVVCTRGACFVGPDNGLFSEALAQPDAAVYVLDQPAYWRSPVSRTFHGRDIFGPVAAHLAAGVAAAALGSPIHDPVRLDWPAAQRQPTDPAAPIMGEVVYTDHFGNLITNIPGAWLDGDPADWRCRIGGQEIAGLSTAYADVPTGALLAIVSSTDTLEIAVREGHAGVRLGVDVGERVTVWAAR
jgi:S-adenosyl-L-methionine hydrolase (adenosine-forming)